jgi:hypothetical protein
VIFLSESTQNFYDEGEDMDDRRAKPRLSVSLNAVWDGTEGKHAARITDLSEGGCYIDTVGEVMSGEIVCFRVLLADGDWLYLEGEVKHHRHKLGFGVQFVDLNEEQLDKLRWLLRLAKEAGTQAPAIQAHLVKE